jgi:putative ABC transport system permease protein
MKFFLLVLKNVARNPLRTALTALGTMVLVFVVTLVWSILAFLDEMTVEKSRDLKAIVTERWRVPSTMPFTYAETLAEGAARRPGDVKPLDSMTWQFYGGTIDPGKLTRDSIVFAVAIEPRKARTMMDELDRLPEDQARELDAVVRRLEQQRNGLILGRERLAAIKKRVGERIKIFSLNYKQIDLEFEIVGQFLPGRYDNSEVMNRDYLNEALDAYARLPGHGRHPMADQSLNLVWLRLRDKEHFQRVAEQIISAPYYSNPAVKCETAASGIASFLDAFRDLIWGMRWLLAPAALVTLSLVIANAISISVRERRTELAVLKVLGFQPWQILAMVVAEALLLGTLAGLGSAGLTYVTINYGLGGLKFPIAMFGSFYINPAALGWGASIGALTALAGSIVPAWSARNVQVAEVFAKVT